MKERPQPGPQPEPQLRHWDMGAVNDAFKQSPSHTKHPFFGHGFGYQLGESKSELTMYPQVGALHFYPGEIDVKLYRTQPPEVSDEFGKESVVMRKTEKDGAQVTFSVDAQGNFLLMRSPGQLGAGERETLAHRPDQTVVERTNEVALPPSSDPSSEPLPATQQTDIPQGEGDSAPAKEKLPRVKFSGRLGRDLDVHVYPNAGAIARLAVAERYEEDGQVKTRWHNVYTNKNRAESLRKKYDEGGLRKGDIVEVEGYPQQHIKKGKDNKPVIKDGTPVTEQRIYAVHVGIR